MKATTIGCMLAVTAVSVSAGFAQAGDSFKTKLTMMYASQESFGFEGFQGTVSSTEKGCVKGRKVKVVYDAPPGYSDKTYADKSGASGKWRVELPYKPPPGDYRAKVKATQIKAGRCKGAKAPPFSP